jgi:hypothetical protein
MAEAVEGSATERVTAPAGCSTAGSPSRPDGGACPTVFSLPLSSAGTAVMCPKIEPGALTTRVTFHPVASQRATTSRRERSWPLKVTCIYIKQQKSAPKRIIQNQTHPHRQIHPIPIRTRLPQISQQRRRSQRALSTLHLLVLVPFAAEIIHTRERQDKIRYEELRIWPCSLSQTKEDLLSKGSGPIVQDHAEQEYSRSSDRLRCKEIMYCQTYIKKRISLNALFQRMKER